MSEERDIRLTKWGWFAVLLPLISLALLIVFLAIVDPWSLLNLAIPFAIGYALGRWA